MNIFDATMIAEGQYDLAGLDSEVITDDTILEAWQTLVNTGTVWQLQGWFGRQAAAMIDAGVIDAAA